MTRDGLWPTSEVAGDEGRIWLRWLVRLRWVALVAQGVTLAVTFRVLDGPWIIAVLAGVMGLLSAGNLWAWRQLQDGNPVPERFLVVQLATEIAALAVFLVLSGGPNNPFIILLLVHVAMAAVMLSWRAAGALVLFVLGTYGLLHLWHLPLHLDRHSLSEGFLTQVGQFVAFGITAASIGVFVLGLGEALRARGHALLDIRDRTARTDRLRAVGTLAAGAAHELNTPLSTVGLRLRRIARRYADEPTVADVTAIRAQLDRCKEIVEQLLAGAGDPAASELVRRPLAQLVDEATTLWRKGTEVGVQIEDLSDGLEIEIPRVAFTQALINLLENARQAQDRIGRTDPLELYVEREGHVGMVRLRDHGCGLPDDPERIGEPFYTTKDDGTGLGVFVARAVADGAGGGLGYYEQKGSWTEARWWFPAVPRRTA